MVLLVAYDVSDNRRRAKLHTLLLGYGVNVQESVFECTLDARQEKQLKRRLTALMKSGEDNVRFYRLCRDCAAAIETLRGSAGGEPPAIVV
jgi:CRISPR-associated protein Cas2